MCLGSHFQCGSVFMTGRAGGRSVGQRVTLRLPLRSREQWLLADAQLAVFLLFGLAL